MPAPGKIQAASSSRPGKGSRTLPKRLTRFRKTSAMRSQSVAAKAFLDDMPVIALESDPE